MNQKKTRGFFIALIIVLSLCVIVFLVSITKNQLNGEFEKLNETDQAILTEYHTLCDSLVEDDIWDGYNLEEKPILALAGSFGGGYLINPTEPISSIFAKEISLPDNWNIKVYRLSAVTPGLMQFLLEGDFNTIDKTYSVFDNQVYFTKYDDTYSVNEKWSNLHFVTYLTHESFHYYMQKNWPTGARFSADGLTDEDLSLLKEEYQVLAEIQEQLLSEAPDQETLQRCAADYVDIMNRRLAANEDYVKKELEMEAVEGTATYVSIHASRRVGYDYGVMYFSNQKNVSFNDIIPQYQAGNLDISYLANRIPYETGALLCLLMDELRIPDWQSAFNEQTSEEPVCAYSIIKDWVEER